MPIGRFAKAMCLASISVLLGLSACNQIVTVETTQFQPNTTTVEITMTATSTITASPSPTTTTPTLPPPTTSTITVGPTSVTVDSVQGLTLTLSLDAFNYRPGQHITATVEEFNTLKVENDVPAEKNWPKVGLSYFPASYPDFPMKIALFRGDLNSAADAWVTPLNFYGLPPPVPVVPVNSWDFHPYSHVVDVVEPGPYIEKDVQELGHVIIDGYYPAGTLKNLEPGPYTIVAGDEWGAIALLHFTVSQ